MQAIGPNPFLFIGAVLFVCGVICMTTKRNGIGVLMGVELVLNGANLNFITFSRFTPLGLDGQVFSLFVIVLAAAEAAVALAIALNFTTTTSRSTSIAGMNCTADVSRTFEI